MCTVPCGPDADDRPASKFIIQETDELWGGINNVLKKGVVNTILRVSTLQTM